MRHSSIRPALAAVFALGVVTLTGCPVQPTCPNCQYRSAQFVASPGDFVDLASARMTTHVEHPASSSSEDNCPIDGEPTPCVSDVANENVVCRVVSSASSNRATVLLPVSSVPTASHQASIVLKKTSGATKTVSTAVVGTPVSSSRPPACR